ncbi:phage integrase N-terminal SAM-like domain-containing protein [Leptothoe spongobia TAU-MAC 1115]|uniref:Phage integrase N-terminal SAM-like domain-containing protein n=1 Tax=Leptothoe spongobia TAU-MAC 1115 TaxID=1967444 RepID=A0A947GLG7_9CYAN|nr:phage integrase N-terminal SAM-like domain-containing protein [Leptothoe spongobia TAU-MAC 1115]
MCKQSNPGTLLEGGCDTIRVKHYSYRTEQSYINWIKRYIQFHDWQYSRKMGWPEVEAFLSHCQAFISGESILGSATPIAPTT